MLGPQRRSCVATIDMPTPTQGLHPCASFLAPMGQRTWTHSQWSLIAVWEALWTVRARGVASLGAQPASVVTTRDSHVGYNLPRPPDSGPEEQWRRNQVCRRCFSRSMALQSMSGRCAQVHCCRGRRKPRDPGDSTTSPLPNLLHFSSTPPHSAAVSMNATWYPFGVLHGITLGFLETYCRTSPHPLPSLL